jgi:predicted N-acyltransferase
MQTVVVDSIEAFGRDEWNRLFPAELEDWNYYCAVEHCGLPDFAFVYFGVREHGRLCAVVPGFVTDYRLDTTVRGRLRRVTDAIARVFPRLLRQRMLSFGSPVAEVCHLGFVTESSATDRQRWLDAMLAEAERYAAQHRVRMIAVKDGSAAQDALWAQAAKTQGLRRQPGLPTALLDVPFTDVDQYLASLSRATRKDLRRKLKVATGLRVEWRDSIDDIATEVMRLYQSTQTNAEFRFEELTPEYFRNVLRELGARALCATYWLEERLVAFNLVLRDDTRLIDKFLGMDDGVARKYNLYFYTWMENVRYCIEHRIRLYQSGQGLHALKVRLGSRLSANWLWYRHRNRIVDTVFTLIERVARMDRHDSELASLLGKSSP